MKMGLASVVSFYHRHEEYPTRYALGTLRVAGYAGQSNKVAVQVKAFSLDTTETSITERLARDEPTIVGFPAYLWTVEKAQRVAKELQRILPETRIVVGGPEARPAPLWPERTTFIAGEAERIFKEVCEGNSSTNVLYGEQGQLPEGMLLYSDEMLALLDKKIEKEFSWFETSRGCLYRCGYCGHKTREDLARFNNDYTREEIKNLGKVGFKRVFVVDPNLGGTAARGKNLLRNFQEYAPNAALTAYLRPEFIDEEYVGLLRQTAIEEVRIGIQTLNKNVPRWIRSNSVKSIMGELHKLEGIAWRAELIIGLPGDTYDGLRESIRIVVDELRPTTIFAYPLTVISGTPLHRILNQQQSHEWIRADTAHRAVESHSYSPEELRQMIAYGTALTSLRMILNNKPRTQSFATLDDMTRTILTRSNSEERKVFETNDLSGARKFWQEYLGRQS